MPPLISNLLDATVPKLLLQLDMYALVDRTVGVLVC